MKRHKLAGEWIDYDLDLFRDVAYPLDRALGQFEEVAGGDSGLADALDYPMRYDNLLGMGLVAAQAYLVSAAAEHSLKRSQALSVGPRHSSGVPLAELINCGANFWKHADEWNWDEPKPRQADTLAAFLKTGISEDDFSFHGLLVQVTGQSRPRLLDVAPVLEQWRGALDETFREESGEPQL